MRYLHWQQLVDVNYEQISFLRLLGSNWILFQGMFMTNQRKKAVVSSPFSGEIAASQIRIKMSNNNNSQRITVPQCRNSVLPHHPVQRWHLSFRLIKSLPSHQSHCLNLSLLQLPLFLNPQVNWEVLSNICICTCYLIHTLNPRRTSLILEGTY